MIATALVALVALIHLAILAMEMLPWETKPVRALFGISPDFAANCRVMAAHQGLSIRFLAVGLLPALLALLAVLTGI